jgi:ferrous iron transport protein A
MTMINDNGSYSQYDVSMMLDDLPDGAPATVTSVVAASPELDAGDLRRLGELGFIPGEQVRVLRRGPGGREPLAVQIGDTLFALRRAEARCVEVVPS